MLHANENERLWAQKYRPQHLDDVILPDSIYKEIKSAIEKDSVQNLILAGSAGLGKTTIAKAIVNDLDASHLFMNASMETSIDGLRTKVQQFVTTASVFDKQGRKVVIMDEGEQLSPQAMNALKSMMETFSRNALFIFTTNHLNKIPDPIKSRCNVIEFNIKPEEKQDVIVKLFKRTAEILKAEYVEFDQALLAKAIKKTFPDMRRLLNLLQKGSIGGELNSAILADETGMNALIDILKSKKWNDMREWCVNHWHTFDYGVFYDELSKVVEPNILPDIVIMISEYDYKEAFVANKEINLVAFLTEVMGSL